MEDPRLQIFVHDLSATGVVRNAIGIANAAAQDGFSVRLLTSVADGPLRREVDRRVTLVPLVSADVARQPRTHQLRRSLIAYRKYAREWRPHVLFSAGNHGHLLSTLAWTGLPGVKILRISNELHRSASRLSPARRLARAAKFQMMTSLADRLVLVSHALEQRPVLSRMTRLGKSIVIPNGVDVERVRAAAEEPCPHPWLTNKELPVVLAVGRHAPQKNFGTLLQAFALARKRTPMRLLFLGGGTAEAISSLRASANALGVAEYVGFEAPTANPFSYMHAADLVALPSLWEGSANVLLEALACGTRVIASQTAGDSSLVLDEGRYGALVDPADPAAMAESMLLQLGEDGVWPGNRAESFSRKASLTRYVQVFRESLQPLTGQ